MGRLCPKPTSLGRKQERYVGYAGIEFGSIPASRCISTAFQRGMTRHLAFEVGQYALYRLKSLANELRKKNDPVEYFKDRKETFFSEFKAQYEQIADHKQCAIVLVSLLKTSVVHAVSNSLAVHVVSEMKATYSRFDTKFSLKTAVLTGIALKGEFDLFCQYIDDTESSLKCWLGEFVEEHCNAKSQDSESTRIEVLVEKKLKELIEHLQATVKLTMVEETALEPWLKQFHQAVTSNGAISLNLEEVLSHMTKHKLNDTEFKEEFLQSINELKISSKAVLDKKGLLARFRRGLWRQGSSSP